MSLLRTIVKELAGLEDILTGTGAVTQTRGTSSITITKINAGNIVYDATDATIVARFAKNISADYLTATFDTVNEKTVAAGVTIDGILIKDSSISSVTTIIATGDITTTGYLAVGTASPDANAALDVVSTTKAFLKPRMTTVQRDAVSSPKLGMEVYDSTLGVPVIFRPTAATPSGSWEAVGGGPSLGDGSFIRTNLDTSSENLTIPSGTNGTTAGPITLTGTITVNGTWTVI